MPRNGRIYQIKKMANATPKANARRGAKAPLDQAGFSWQKHVVDESEKEDWGCRVCYAKFAAQGRQHHYQFISGERLLYRPEPQGCGQHNGGVLSGGGKRNRDETPSKDGVP